MSDGMGTFGVFTGLCYELVIDRVDADHGEEKCCSFSGRGYALARTALFGVLTPFAPIVIGIHFYQSFTSENSSDFQNYWKERKCIALLDVAVSVILSPLLMLVYTVRCVVAAIFHPGLLYKKSSNAIACELAAERAAPGGQRATAGRGSSRRAKGSSYSGGAEGNGAPRAAAAAAAAASPYDGTGAAANASGGGGGGGGTGAGTIPGSGHASAYAGGD